MFLRSICKHKDLEHEEIECIWVEIMLLRASPILFCIAYRPPQSLSNWLALFERMIEQATSEIKGVIILGDFNINLLNEYSIVRRWMDVFNDFGMIQLLSEPTRIADISLSLIDHAYVLNPENIRYTGTINCGASDHFPICVVYKKKFSGISQEHVQSHEYITYRSFKKFNEEDYLKDLSTIPWDIIDSTDIDMMLEKWYDLFLCVVNMHLPIKQRRVKFRNQPEWFGNDIKTRVNNLTQWRVWKNKVNHLISESKSVYYKTLLEKNKNNPKAFWKIFKELIPKKTTNSINLLCQN